MWKGKLFRCWKTPHDAVESSTMRNSHPRTPLALRPAIPSPSFAPDSSLAHTPIRVVHLYVTFLPLFFLPFRIHKHTPSDWPLGPLISFLFSCRSFSILSFLFFTNCLISPVLPVELRGGRRGGGGGAQPRTPTHQTGTGQSIHSPNYAADAPHCHFLSSTLKTKDKKKLDSKLTLWQE